MSCGLPKPTVSYFFQMQKITERDTREVDILIRRSNVMLNENALK
jgi:hypothetical protein